MDYYDLYHMKLHEKKIINHEYMVLRVPGGWVYSHMRLDKEAISTTFVPESSE